MKPILGWLLIICLKEIKVFHQKLFFSSDQILVITFTSDVICLFLSLISEALRVVHQFFYPAGGGRRRNTRDLTVFLLLISPLSQYFSHWTMESRSSSSSLKVLEGVGSWVREVWWCSGLSREPGVMYGLLEWTELSLYVETELGDRESRVSR